MKILHGKDSVPVPGNAQVGTSVEGTCRVGEEIVVLFILLASAIWVKQLNKFKKNIRSDIMPGWG